MNAFQAALAAKAQALNQARLATKPEAKSVPAPEQKPINVFIDLHKKDNEIRISFTDQPSDGIKKLMLANGWKVQLVAGIWSHDDCEANREFCRKVFNAVLDPYEDHTVSDGCAVIDAPVLESDPVPSLDNDGSPDFNRYKQQIRELLEHLKVDCADLQLMAIDSFHKATFARN